MSIDETWPSTLNLLSLVAIVSVTKNPARVPDLCTGGGEKEFTGVAFDFSTWKIRGT